ncbi:hypothetical protein L9F63_005571, partial [Diploptera punctata]
PLYSHMKVYVLLLIDINAFNLEVVRKNSTAFESYIIQILNTNGQIVNTCTS